MGRPRGAGALIVTRSGKILLTAEGRGTRIRVRRDAAMEEVRDAARALAERLIARQRSIRHRDVIVETIDGERAALSRWAPAFRESGFKGMGTGLRFYAVV